MNTQIIQKDEGQIVKNALESLKHFENFEKKLREAESELRQSRRIQRDNQVEMRKIQNIPYEETMEDKLIWEIYDKFTEIQHNIDWIKDGENADYPDFPDDEDIKKEKMKEEFWKSC